MIPFLNIHGQQSSLAIVYPTSCNPKSLESATSIHHPSDIMDALGDLVAKVIILLFILSFVVPQSQDTSVPLVSLGCSWKALIDLIVRCEQVMGADDAQYGKMDGGSSGFSGTSGESLSHPRLEQLDLEVCSETDLRICIPLPCRLAGGFAWFCCNFSDHASPWLGSISLQRLE